MQVPILNGVYADSSADFRTSYPRNMVPVPKDQGISKGYLRPADGIVQFGVGPGVDRGGVNWNGLCYRVMGTKLVSINAAGVHTEIGDVGDGGQCTLDYSFDRLAVCSGGRFYLWDGFTLTQVTDPDLGPVLDFMYIDGYFMTTDGTSLVVTELVDPTAVDPLKYGSSELDPDAVMRVLKLRNEALAVNRYTVEVFSNVGGEGFPFRRVDGAQLHRGAIGTYAAALFADGLAFVGSARKEPPAVWLGAGGATVKLSTREIDTLLQGYTEAQLALTLVETRVDKAHNLLLVHLPDRTLQYDAAASAEVGEPVWCTLDSGNLQPSKYRARNLVWCYDKWLCGDPLSSAHGFLTSALSTHYGQKTGWDFGTLIVYNAGRGAIFHDLELVGLPGSPDIFDIAVAPPTLDFLRTFTPPDDTLAGLSSYNVTPAIGSGLLDVPGPGTAGVGMVRVDGIPVHENGTYTVRMKIPTVTAALSVTGPCWLQSYWATPTSNGSFGYWIQVRGATDGSALILLKGKDANISGNTLLANVPHGAADDAMTEFRIQYETVAGPGKRIRIYVNNVLKIDHTDTNDGGVGPYLTGQCGVVSFSGIVFGNLLYESFAHSRANPGAGGLVFTPILDRDPVVWTSHSVDGKTFSQERAVRAGKVGQTQQRMVWRRAGSMRHWRVQRFRGTSDTHMSFARLEVNAEPLGG